MVVIEDGTGIVNADSFIDEATFTTLYNDYDGGDLTSVTTNQISIALRSAAAYIGNLDLVGTKTYKRLQGTCLPRIGLVDKDGNSLASTEIPTEFKMAQFYLAKAIINGAGTLDPEINPQKAAAIKKERSKLDVLEEEFEYENSSKDFPKDNRSHYQIAKEAATLISPMAMDLLEPFMNAPLGMSLPLAGGIVFG